jgi:hypothetical protein
MPKGNIHARIERLRERVGPPDNPGDGEAREKVMRALETIQRLILECGDEIDRDYRERVGTGEDHLAALVGAKREAVTATEEGRRAWAVADAIRERGGGRGES